MGGINPVTGLIAHIDVAVNPAGRVQRGRNRPAIRTAVHSGVVSGGALSVSRGSTLGMMAEVVAARAAETKRIESCILDLEGIGLLVFEYCEIRLERKKSKNFGYLDCNNGGRDQT